MRLPKKPPTLIDSELEQMTWVERWMYLDAHRKYAHEMKTLCFRLGGILLLVSGFLLVLGDLLG